MYAEAAFQLKKTYVLYIKSIIYHFYEMKRH